MVKSIRMSQMPGGEEAVLPAAGIETSYKLWRIAPWRRDLLTSHNGTELGSVTYYVDFAFSHISPWLLRHIYGYKIDGYA